MKNNLNKGFVAQGLLLGVLFIIVAGASYYVGTRKVESPTIIENNFKPVTQDSLDNVKPISNNDKSTEKVVDNKVTEQFKTYTDTVNGISFSYPSKINLKKLYDGTQLYHSVLFDNYAGGCDLKGDSKLSKTIDDFNISIKVINGNKQAPSYAEQYISGEMNGLKAYMGAEGCGQTSYYFPISGNRTLVITKVELQALSGVVDPSESKKLLSIPGVISSQESYNIIDEIISSIKVNSVVTKSTDVDNSQVSSYGTQGRCGINIDSPIANFAVKFPVTISGSIDNSNYEELGCKWIISEEKAATAQLYYNYNDHGWTPADIAIPIKFNGYTNGKATFSTKMDFKNDNDIVISVGTPMKIVFKDMGEIDGQVANKFDLPINYR